MAYVMHKNILSDYMSLIPGLQSGSDYDIEMLNKILNIVTFLHILQFVVDVCQLKTFDFFGAQTTLMRICMIIVYILIILIYYTV